MSVNGNAPFRATAVERYARSSQPAVPVRRPSIGLLLAVWGLLLLALAAGGVWLTIAWAYLGR